VVHIVLLLSRRTLYVFLSLIIVSPLSCTREPSSAWFGVQLGLSMTDTRARFQPPSAGTWTIQTEPLSGLTWLPDDEQEPLRRARFEFHQGMLVAARFSLSDASPIAQGHALEATATRVTVRQRGDDHTTQLVVLARSCPAHAAEIRALVQSSGANTR